MLFSKKTKPSRTRQPSYGLNESFRRNNVVVSRSQREISARQQSVTQRQIDKKKRISRQRVKIRLITVLTIIFAAVFLWRMGITSAHVTAAKPYALTPSQQADYQATIIKQYKNHTLFGQSWLLDEDGFKQAVINQHPEIASLALKTHTPFTPEMDATLNFRKPIFTWQDASKTERFIDVNGVLFSANLDRTIDTKKLVHIEDQSGAVLDAGTSVLTDSLVQFVSQLHTSLPPLYNNAPIARVIIPKSTREVQIQMDKVPYLIKFSSEHQVGEVVTELQSLLTYLKGKGITPVNYIDLRVPNRAFYK